MDSLQALHLIKNANTYLAYHATKMDLVILNETTYEALQQVKNGLSLQAVAQSLHVSEDAIDSIIKKLTFPDSPHPQWNISSKKIERITLHVSNDCNLRCKYCYANGGHYNQARDMMDVQTAEAFVSFCMQTFTDIGTIVFFGGEPCLNLPVMKYVCNRFEELYAAKQISFLPQFGIITNGTIINEDIIHFIQAHLAFITVSIDGNKEVHDANRVFANGKGSYDKIAMFIQTLQQRTNIPIKYEATYTQYHIDNGYTQRDVADFMEHEFGLKGEVIEEMSVQSSCTEDYWANYTFEDWKKKGLSHYPEGFWSVLSAISSKRPKVMCGIAHTIFAVSTHGDIYPCHIDTGTKEICLGNICGENIFNTFANRNVYFPTNVEDNETCRTCWANKICGGCSRTWFYQEEQKKFAKYPKAELCKQNKRHLERILWMIATIKQEPEVWKQCIEQLK